MPEQTEQNIYFTEEELELISELVNEKWGELNALAGKITCFMEGEQSDN